MEYPARLPNEDGAAYYRRAQAIIEARRKNERREQGEANRRDAQKRRNESDRDEARYLFLTLPRCSDCGGKDFTTMRTEASGEVTTRRVTCKNPDCSAKFFLIVE